MRLHPYIRGLSSVFLAGSLAYGVSRFLSNEPCDLERSSRAIRGGYARDQDWTDMGAGVGLLMSAIIVVPYVAEKVTHLKKPESRDREER